jgi:hypothetical protein
VRGNSVDDLFLAERSVLDAHFLIPVVHLSVATSAGARVRNWHPGPLGDWNLSDVSLEADSR